MNIDCHYYGTYYISRVSGFTHEEALDIAWAAQTVDECHLEHMEEIEEKFEDEVYPSEKKGRYDENFILTVLDATDDIRHTSSLNSLNENGKNRYALNAIRSIWMPFHFLPGNFSGALPNYSLKIYNGENKTINEQDEHDMKLMCRTTTATCQKMIEIAETQYQKFKGNNKRKALFAVGIVMHVLADTWSHEYFVGSPNRCINSVNDEFTWDKVQFLQAYSGLGSLWSDYTYDNVGHGLAGHKPDYSYLGNEYSVAHGWMSNCREGQRSIIRNNRERFYNAFAQMLLVLLYVRGENIKFSEILTNTLKNRYTEKYGYYFRKIKTVLNKRKYEYIGFMKRRKILENPTYDDVNLICDFWNEKIEKDFGHKIPEYDFFGKDIDAITDFMQMAKIHRNGILGYVNQFVENVFPVKYDRSVDYKEIDRCIRKLYDDLTW